MSDWLNRYIGRTGRRSHRLRRLHRYENCETKPPSPRALSRRMGEGAIRDLCNPSLQLFAKRTQCLVPGVFYTVPHGSRCGLMELASSFLPNEPMRSERRFKVSGSTCKFAVAEPPCLGTYLKIAKRTHFKAGIVAADEEITKRTHRLRPVPSFTLKVPGSGSAKSAVSTAHPKYTKRSQLQTRSSKLVTLFTKRTHSDP